MSNIINSISQPSFLAYINANITNITGDGTIYQVVFNTLSQGANFNTTTGVFTSSIAGKYQFSVNLDIGGLSASHTNGTINLVTTGGTYPLMGCSPGAIKSPVNACTLNGSSNLIAMNSGDTAYINIQVSGGTKVVSINSISLPDVLTFFCGRRFI